MRDRDVMASLLRARSGHLETWARQMVVLVEDEVRERTLVGLPKEAVRQ